MLFASLAAAAALHVSVLPPAAQLAAVERALPYHLLVLPQSLQLVRAELIRDGAGVPGARIEYSIEGAIVDIDERPVDPAGAPPDSDDAPRIFNINGYPAVFHEMGGGYRHLNALVWLRSDLQVTISSRDRVSAPMLLDVALDLR
jgi:hypothetical protein